MIRKQWLDVVRLARNPDFKAIPYLTLDVFHNCALDRNRRSVTQLEVASLLYGHCATFGGTWLHSEEAEIEQLSKRFDIVG